MMEAVLAYLDPCALTLPPNLNVGLAPVTQACKNYMPSLFEARRRRMASYLSWDLRLAQNLCHRADEMFGRNTCVACNRTCPASDVGVAGVCVPRKHAQCVRCSAVFCSGCRVLLLAKLHKSANDGFCWQCLLAALKTAKAFKRKRQLRIAVRFYMQRWDEVLCFEALALPTPLRTIVRDYVNC
jgi:hypothetical protein